MDEIRVLYLLKGTSCEAEQSEVAASAKRRFIDSNMLRLDDASKGHVHPGTGTVFTCHLFHIARCLLRYSHVGSQATSTISRAGSHEPHVTPRSMLSASMAVR